MKLDHGRAIALIILLTITATSSATWYLTVHSLSAPTLPSYDYPGSGQNHWTYFIYQDTGGTWLRIRGDTRQQDDWSAGDSPVTDPIPLINRAITLLLNTTGILEVKGDFTSAGTVTINEYFGGYYHYGTQTVTGNHVGILCNDPHSGYSDYTHTGMRIYVQGISGPSGISGVDFASYPNGAGLRLQNCMQHTIEIGEILGFQYGVLVDQSVLDTRSGRSTVADNSISINTLINNNYAVRYLGPAAGTPNNVITGCQGNVWHLNIIAPNNGAFGIVKDTGLLHQYTQWYGMSFVPIGGASGTFINNAGASGAPAGADLIVSVYWVNNANNILQTGDTLIIQNSPADAGGPYGQTGRFPNISTSNKQIGVSFTTATSKAVTFPIVQADTSYSVIVVFHQNSGNYWITSLGTTGCTINWSTSSTGTLDYFVYR